MADESPSKPCNCLVLLHKSRSTGYLACQSCRTRPVWFPIKICSAQNLSPNIWPDDATFVRFSEENLFSSQVYEAIFDGNFSHLKICYLEEVTLLQKLRRRNTRRGTEFFMERVHSSGALVTKLINKIPYADWSELLLSMNPLARVFWVSRLKKLHA